MKTKWLASLILASAVSAPAFAQVGIYIGHEPPPLRYEVRPAMPGPGYAWVDGYWNWSGADMSGPLECGADRPMPAPIGAIPTTTTMTVDGPTMRATGIMKITAPTTNGNTTKFQARFNRARPGNWPGPCFLALT